MCKLTNKEKWAMEQSGETENGHGTNVNYWKVRQRWKMGSSSISDNPCWRRENWERVGEVWIHRLAPGKGNLKNKSSLGRHHPRAKQEASAMKSILRTTCCPLHSQVNTTTVGDLAERSQLARQEDKRLDMIWTGSQIEAHSSELRRLC